MKELDFEKMKKNWKNSNHNYDFIHCLKKEKLKTYKTITYIIFLALLISSFQVYMLPKTTSLLYKFLCFTLSTLMWIIFTFCIFRHFIYNKKNEYDKQSSLDLIDFQIKDIIKYYSQKNLFKRL